MPISATAMPSYAFWWKAWMGASPYFSLYFSTSSGYRLPIASGEVSGLVNTKSTAASPAASRNPGAISALPPMGVVLSRPLISGNWRTIWAAAATKIGKYTTQGSVVAMRVSTGRMSTSVGATASAAVTDPPSSLKRFSATRTSCSA